MSSLTTDDQKLRVVRSLFDSEFDAAASAYKERPSGDNFSRLKDAMYAYQYSHSHNEKDELIALYNHHPVGQWLPSVVRRIKESLKSAGAPY